MQTENRKSPEELSDRDLIDALTITNCRNRYTDAERERIHGILTSRGYSDSAILRLDRSEEVRAEERARKHCTGLHSPDRCGSWTDVITSGAVSGIAFLISMSVLEGGARIIVPGLAIAFFITNKNFRFSLLQKGIALALMFMIGFFAHDIIGLLRQH